MCVANRHFRTHTNTRTPTYVPMRNTFIEHDTSLITLPLLTLRSTRCSLGLEAVQAISPRRFLEAAQSANDASLFFTVFKFFEQRNMALRKRPEFAPGACLCMLL